MSAQVTNYKCPHCTGPLHFVGSSGKLECDYCGSAFSVAEIEAIYAEKEQAAAQAYQTAQSQPSADGGSWDLSGLSDDWGTDAEGMKSYSCPSCGAEMICDASTAATSCPYCGNPTVVSGQFSGALKPDYVIPFKLSKEDAMAALKKHYHGKPFLPKSFTKGNHVEEIKGVYVPFWMFDGAASGSAPYTATRSRKTRQGNEEVTLTEHYDVYRAGELAFQKVPVDASTKMPDDHMDSIEQYNCAELKPFSTAYLPGFLADKYDVTVEDSYSRADERCKSTLSNALRATVQGFESCTPVNEQSILMRGKVHYALMPVWLLNTKWQGKDFLFAMNGQTGKLVGDLPMSWGRFWSLFAAIAVPLSIIGSIITLL
jgi:uncharacterized Zn finger protein (UPF0148 family)